MESGGMLTEYSEVLNSIFQIITSHGEPVCMVVLLALLKSEVANTHMQVFSSLARKLDDDDFRRHLLTLETAEQVTSYLAAQLGLPSGFVKPHSLAAERIEYTPGPRTCK
jgi:hypothetical protein